jgi:hypothetical protein
MQNLFIALVPKYGSIYRLSNHVPLLIAVSEFIGSCCEMSDDSMMMMMMRGGGGGVGYDATQSLRQ